MHPITFTHPDPDDGRTIVRVSKALARRLWDKGYPLQTRDGFGAAYGHRGDGIPVPRETREGQDNNPYGHGASFDAFANAQDYYATRVVIYFAYAEDVAANRAHPTAQWSGDWREL